MSRRGRDDRGDRGSANLRCAGGFGVVPDLDLTVGAGAVFTIKDVGEACGLPHPVIAQLVPRTWTASGWMYTAAQVHAAVVLAERLRRPRAAETTQPHHDAMSALVCRRCGAVATGVDSDLGRWLTPVTSNRADSLGPAYCPACVIPCATCRSAVRGALTCRRCGGVGRVPRPELSAN